MAPGFDDDDEGAPTTEASDLTPATSAEPASQRRALPSHSIPGERYELAAQLGHGGMGEVMHARDRQIGRDVAIKRMRGDAPSERAMQRFLREAKIQGRLDHPAIVPVHELGRARDGRPYFAMKKLAGRTLAAILKTPDAPRQRMLRAFADVCLAVEFAHQRGFLHRDLKPDNIMLGDFGETYVLDWGVAKLLGRPDDDLDGGPAQTDELATVAGSVIGTPGYMSPEQATGDPGIDARADVYALGCVLFEILTGTPLHPRGSAGLASSVAGIDARPSRRAPERDIPPELDDLCVRATAACAERIATARELGDAVQRYLDGDRDLAQRRSLAAAHLESAEAALVAGDRRAATRNAGRALALDPTLRGAAELVSRLMLEPPPSLPPEVEQSLAEDTDAVIRRTAFTGLVSSVGYTLAVPLLFATSRVPPTWIVALVALVAVNTALLLRGTRTDVRFPQGAILAVNAVIVALTSAMGSWLLGPPLAVLTVMGIMAGRYYSVRQGVLVGGTVIAAMFAPRLAELGGMLPVTMHVTGHVLAIDAPLFHGETSTYVWLIALPPLMVAAAIILMRGLRKSERTARRQLHLQAWQLRQLVPD
ncbi:MAG: serine/threonine protein kinase [Deltaproteobacteria bacterium]|nr:serine/threonine protein kinase [Deltaproteobacteria bacterium]MDQ3295454.1 serine/threonine protein kinase [Myxococcota bacterium]